MKIIKGLIILLLFIACNSKGNHELSIEQLSIKHQACLDSGVDMMGCSKTFYFEMDSMLNVVYNEYKMTLKPNERKALQTEQTEWLKKRDTFIDRENKAFQEKLETDEWGPDMYMIVYDNDAEFVKKRTIELIKRMKK